MASIPKELLEKREVTECNFIFSLYKDMDLIPEYKNVENETDIITDDGKFYYGLIQAMYRAGFHSVDNMAVYSYVEDKPTIKKGFESRGGWNAVKDILDVVSVNNVGAFYDELIRDNMLIRLHQSGFNVLEKLKKLKQMSSQELYDYYEYQLSNISVGKIEKIKAENLSDGYEGWLERANSTKNVGFEIGSKLLNYKTIGIHKGCLTLYAGGIGQGKTSSSIWLFILPAIENGHDICILCNEQTADEYRNMLIASVLFGRVGNVTGMNRTTITKGNYNDYQISKMREAIKWIEEQPGKITFLSMEDYDITNVKKIITKYAKLGCEYFFYDVLKNNDSSEQAWIELTDTAKMLSVLAKKEDVAILATVQLAPDSMNRKYLDLTAIGKSRGMSECATCVLGFLPVRNNEVDRIKPWQWKMSENGSSKKIKKVYDLDPNQHYITMFIMKNRWGDTNEQIVMEFNQSFNIMRDVGFVNVAFDDFRRD